MKKLKYIIYNGNNILAKIWENEEGVLVLTPDSTAYLDFNFDIEVRDEYGIPVNHLDLLDFFLNLIKEKSN